MIEKRPSPIHGFGNFAIQEIKRGTLLINWMNGSTIIDKSKYNPSNQTSIRLFGDLFLDGEKEDSDYINHSDNPNCIYIFGLVFAKENLKVDEELTLDYREFLTPNDFNVVSGSDAKEAIVSQVGWLIRNLDSLST